MIQALLTGPGILGTRAPLHSDLSLILILLSAILFTIGWRLAVRKKFKPHRWIQTGAAILNTIVVLVVMIASFIIYILPGIPGKLFESTYGVTTVHAFIGVLGLLLGVFVVLRANGLVPKRLRFKNYKLFMRTSYVLYMLETLIGVIVYLAVYVAGPA
jgi:putative membrane protein